MKRRVTWRKRVTFNPNSVRRRCKYSNYRVHQTVMRLNIYHTKAGGRCVCLLMADSVLISRLSTDKKPLLGVHKRYKLAPAGPKQDSFETGSLAAVPHNSREDTSRRLCTDIHIIISSCTL